MRLVGCPVGPTSGVWSWDRLTIGTLLGQPHTSGDHWGTVMPDPRIPDVWNRTPEAKTVTIKVNNRLLNVYKQLAVRLRAFHLGQRGPEFLPIYSYCLRCILHPESSSQPLRRLCTFNKFCGRQSACDPLLSMHSMDRS